MTRRIGRTYPGPPPEVVGLAITKKSSPQGGIEKNTHQMGTEQSTPQGGIEKNPASQG